MVAETTLRINRWLQTIQEFDRLIEATQDELVHFAAYRLGNREDAEDVVQDVYIQAFRGREKRRNITDVRPYLFRMTGNRCTDFLRVRSRRLRQEPATIVSREDPFDSLVADQRVTGLLSLLEQLPAREAEVIRLRAWSDLTFAEVATAVQAPVPTVKSRFRYGIEKLRKLLTCEGGPIQ
jgi:RNA polymerase sigma-70 factor (ECF subfamily)